MEEEQITETIQVTGKYPCRKCKECKYLNEGLCGACGCFVELRAVIAVNRCPYEKW